VKRRLIIAAGVGVLAVSTATPAMAFWTAGARSNLQVTANAGTLGSIPAASATSARPKKGTGAGIPTFTIATAAPGAAGYHVTLGGTAVCDITAATGTCAASTSTGYDGGRDFIVTPFAGLWTTASSVTCTYHDANDESVTCTATP